MNRDKLKIANKSLIDGTDELIKTAKETIFSSFLKEVDIDSLIDNPDEYQNEMLVILQNIFEPYFVKAIDKGEQHGKELVEAFNGEAS